MAAPSETSIANAALAHLGERRINSIDDNTKTARLLKERFDDVRDSLLRRHQWNFATKRDSLSADADAPAWGYSRQFTPPADMLKLVAVRDARNHEYRFEGGKILTDLVAPLEIVYIAQITSAAEMDHLFREALSALLAAEVAEAITGDDTQVRTLIAIADEKIAQARNADGQEDPPNMIEASEWLDARYERGPERRIPSGTGTPL